MMNKLTKEEENIIIIALRAKLLIIRNLGVDFARRQLVIKSKEGKSIKFKGDYQELKKLSKTLDYDPWEFYRTQISQYNLIIEKLGGKKEEI